jgi:hypothetical protein
MLTTSIFPGLRLDVHAAPGGEANRDETTRDDGVAVVERLAGAPGSVSERAC